MKIDYFPVRSGALVAPGGEPNCLFIRHDDGRIMTSKEVWAEIERLRAERDALLADAERYRWLREMATPELGKIAHLHSRSIKTNFSTPMAVLEANVRGDVDAAIDAALAAKG